MTCRIYYSLCYAVLGKVVRKWRIEWIVYMAVMLLLIISNTENRQGYIICDCTNTITNYIRYVLS